MTIHQKIPAFLLLTVSVLLLLDPYRFAEPLAWLLTGYALGLLHVVETIWTKIGKAKR